MEKSNDVSNLKADAPESTEVQTSVVQQQPSATPEQPLSEPTPPQTTSKKWLIPSLIALVIFAVGVAGYFAYQNLQLKKEQPSSGQTTPTPTTTIPTPTTDPTSDWETYSGNGYSFKYPKGLKSDTGAAGQGVESIRVQFMGPKQVASGRTETSLFDGYSFVVTKISSNTSKTAQQQAQEERVNSEENCGFDQSIISPITQTQVAGTSASQYSVAECFGDYTSSYLVNNANLYRITQLYTGEEPEKQDYKAITNQILSTLKFTSQTQAPTSNWETYSNESAGFSIKHPVGWRKVETENWTGFGPQEIGEDVLWGVSFYNKSEKTIAQIKDDVGKQFDDRKQTEETITLDGLTAIKVVTTTNQFADWYSVVIIIDNGNMLYSIGNGAQTDTALNEMLAKRTGQDYDITFEDYYTSFKLVK
jgi:hypothetical protein